MQYRKKFTTLLLSICALLIFTRSDAMAEKRPLSKKELEETATHIVVGKVQAIHSRKERKGNYEHTRFLAEVRVDKQERGEGPDGLMYMRYFTISWKGPGQIPPGPSGHHPLPKHDGTYRFYLSRNAYDGFSLNGNNDGGYNVVYGNGVQPAEPPQRTGADATKPGPRETFVKYFQAMDARESDVANALKASECTDNLNMNIHNLDIVERLQPFYELSTSNQALVVVHPFTISSKVLDREEVIYAQLVKKNGAWRIQKLSRTTPENASSLMKGFQVHSDVSLDLSTQALIGQWWYPCDSTIVLKADGSGSDLEVGPFAPAPDQKPEPFKWTVHGSTLILRFAEREEKFDITSIDHSRVTFKTDNKTGRDGWRRRARDLGDFEAKLKADPQYLMRLLAEYRDTGETLLRAAQKQRPTARPWALDMQGLFACDIFTGKSLVGREKVAHFKHAFEYLQESYDIAVQTLDKSHDEELQAALPGLRLDLALAALEAGELDTAKQHAADTLRNNTDRKHWNDGNIIHNANQILGRCALREGKLADAKDYVLKAGATPGSPQLNSFGPQMQLARELLEKGEKETVLGYLDLVARFWANPDERTEANSRQTAREHLNQLEIWKKQIHAGKIPDRTKWK